MQITTQKRPLKTLLICFPEFNRYLNNTFTQDSLNFNDIQIIIQNNPNISCQIIFDENSSDTYKKLFNQDLLHESECEISVIKIIDPRTELFEESFSSEKEPEKAKRPLKVMNVKHKFDQPLSVQYLISEIDAKSDADENQYQNQAGAKFESRMNFSSVNFFKSFQKTLQKLFHCFQKQEFQNNFFRNKANDKKHSNTDSVQSISNSSDETTEQNKSISSLASDKNQSKIKSCPLPSLDRKIYHQSFISSSNSFYRLETPSKDANYSMIKPFHVVLLRDQDRNSSNLLTEDGVKFIYVSNEEFDQITALICRKKQKKYAKHPKKTRYICVKLSALKNELNYKDKQNLNDVLSVLGSVWKFRIIIYSHQSIEKQIKILNEQSCDFQIFGHIVVKKNLKGLTKKYFDRTLGRDIYYLPEDMDEWHDRLEMKKKNCYLVLDQHNRTVITNGSDYKKISTFDLFEGLLEMHKIELKTRQNLSQQKFFEKELKLMSKSSDFELVQSDSCETGSLTSTQLFRELSNTNRLFVGKASLEEIGLDKYLANEINEYKEILWFKFYQAYGVRVPDNCLSYQLPNQNISKINAEKNSTPKLHIMTQSLENYIQLGEKFIENYKKNKKYFFYPKAYEYGPLFGFGRSLALALLLDDINCLGRTGKNMGFIKMKGFLELIKIDTAENFSNKEYKANNLFSLEESQEILLSMLGLKIKFKELCGHDQMEFLLTIQQFMEENQREIKIWNLFDKTCCAKIFLTIKEELEERKAIICKTFLHAASQNINSIEVNDVDFDNIQQNFEESILTIKLELIQKASKSEGFDKTATIIKLLQHVYKFKLYVDSFSKEDEIVESERKQDEAIEDLSKSLRIDGQIIAINKFNATNEFNKTKNRYVYKLGGDRKSWNLELRVHENYYYSVFGENNDVRSMKNCKQQKTKNLFDALQNIYKNQITTQIEFVQKLIPKNISPIFRNKNEFTFFKNKQTSVSNSPIFKTFVNNLNQQKFVAKSCFSNLHTQDQQINEFIIYQEVLRLQIYSIFGVTAPHCCMSQQVINQIQMPCLMIQRMKHFHPLGKSFIFKYKKNLHYFFYPESESDGPLIGFGSALLISYLLNNSNSLGTTGQNMGYIKRNGHCKLVKVDSIETLPNNISQLNNSEDEGFFVAGIDGISISFDDLCEYDKLEFMTIAYQLISSESVEHTIWNQFVSVNCSGKMDAIREEWNRRKKLIFEVFSVKVDKPDHCYLQTNKKTRDDALCIQLSLLENAFKDGRSRDLMSMLMLLEQLFKFRIYVVSEDEEFNQDKILEQLKLRFTITGQIIAVSDPDFTRQKLFSTVKHRYVYKMTNNMRKVCEGLNIFKNDIFYIYSSRNGASVFNKNESKEFNSITSVIRKIYENQQTVKRESIRQKSTESAQACNNLLRSAEDFVSLEVDNNIFERSSRIQQFFEAKEPNRVFVSKESKDRIGVESEEENSFKMYKAALGFRIYSAFNINVPQCYLSYQLPLQKSTISSNKPKKLYLMTHYLTDFKPFASQFLQQYKNSKTYFYNPTNIEDGPLIGFGATLAIAHILDDNEWLDKDISKVGYIKRFGYLEFTKIDAEEIFPSHKQEQHRQDNLRGEAQTPILTNGNTQIYYSDLCEHDRFEFAVVVKILRNSNDIENKVWDQFVSSIHANNFEELKKKWINRKSAFLNYFVGVINSRLDYNITINFSQGISNESEQKTDPVADLNSFLNSSHNEKRFFTTNTIYIVIEEEFLGKGAFGIVYKGYLRNDPTVRIAIKRMVDGNNREPRLNAGKQSIEGTEKDDIDREIEALMDVKKLRSPFLVYYYGAQVVKIGGKKTLELAMELCEGNLKWYLNAVANNGKQLSEFEKVVIFCQIVEGLVMLHKYNITHRDLKPDNILHKKVLIDGEEVIVWKIGDFGLASRKTEMTAREGTPIYMAPEIGEGNIYTKAVDIWSLGLILHRLLFGTEFPNDREDEYRLPNNADIVDSEIKELLVKMMKVKSEERITINSIQDLLKEREEYKVVRKMIYYDDEIEKKRDEIKEIEVNESGDIENIKEAWKYLEIGDEWKETGSYNKALSIYKAALSNIMKAGVERSFVIYGAAQERIGAVLQLLGKYEEAFAYHCYVLSIRVQQYEDDHAQIASIYVNIGNVLNSLGKYEKALEYLNRALSIFAKQYGEHCIQNTITYNDIGNALQSLGKYEEALTNYNSALTIFVREYGEQHVKTASTYHNIGTTLQSLGKYEEARRYYNRALSIFCKQYGEEHIEAASTYHNIGNVLESLGKYEEALTYYKSVLSINIKHYGKQHIQTAYTYNNIGTTLQSLGKYEEALTYCNRALSIKVKQYGELHIEVASTYENIGSALFSLGKYEEALTYYNNALSIQFNQYGEQHVQTASTYTNIGVILGSLGKYNEALVHYNRALLMYGKQYGDNHINILPIYENIGNALQSLGIYEEALSYYNYALLLCVKHYGKCHVQAASIYHSIGNTLKSLGKYREALIYYGCALSINVTQHGKQNIQTAPIYEDIGAAKQLLGEHEDALTYLTYSLSIKVKQYGEHHIAIVSTYSNIGNVLQSLGKYKEALTYRNYVLMLCVKHYGEQHIQTAAAYTNIGNLLRLEGKYEEALACHNYALSIQVKHYGEQHIETASTYNNMSNVLHSLGKFEEALHFYKNVLLIYIYHYGDQHTLTALIYHNIASVLQSLNKYEEALSYHNHVLSIKVKHYGEQHIEVSSTYSSIGSALLSLGKYEEAQVLFHKALSINIKYFGSNHIKTALAYVSLGIIFEELHNYNEALQQFHQALPVCISVYGQAESFTQMLIEKINKCQCNLTDLNFDQINFQFCLFNIRQYVCETVFPF